MKSTSLLFFILVSLFSFPGLAQKICSPIADTVSLEMFSDGIHHWNLVHPERTYKRWNSRQHIQIGNNLLAYQNADGGWPKNMDWLAMLDIDSIKRVSAGKEIQSTFDNNNVYSQVDYLSHVYCLTGDKKYKMSAEKGLAFIIGAQNKSGGWRGWDVDAITFNDEVMTGIMGVLLDIQQNQTHYQWLSADLRKRTLHSLHKAITATLKCQIVVKGKKTAWCQQHDHTTLLPTKARTYELPSITSRESVNVIDFLLRIENPSDSVKEAINSAVEWLQNSAIKGLRIDKVPTANIINQEYKYDKVEVRDPSAPPIWARFYDLNDNHYFMCNRDGKVVFRLADVAAERRTGYEWFGYWPQELIEVRYPAWKKKNGL